jgi:NAD(P)-dependent dehydrogenase (short-subunit alcohol dehydrogenase family)
MSFTGKVVLITGASSGIGADAAIHLAKLGASVAIVGRNSANLNGVAQQIIANGALAEPLEIVADVTIDAERIINETIAHFGQLDVLINNAGILEMNSIETCTLDSFDRIMNTNVRSVLALTQLAVSHLEKTKGNIVNVSSVAGSIPVTTALAYCTSKAALDHFTRCVALDLAKKGIRVNSVNPGVIVTPIFKTIGINDEGLEALIKYTAETYPLGRAGAVSDTSKAIEFLAGDNSPFITGHLLNVDGGTLLAPVGAIQRQ